MEEFDNGWYIDSSEMINTCYSSFSIKKEIFSILDIYFEYKNKNKEKEECEYHQEIIKWIKENYKKENEIYFSLHFIKDKIKMNVLGKRKSQNYIENNNNFVSCLEMINKISKKFTNNEEILDIIDISVLESIRYKNNNNILEYSLNIDELFNIIYENNSNIEKLLKYNNKLYIIPKKSNFILSDYKDINKICNYVQKNNGYHCIVMDPPWENKSVKRKNNYESFYMKRLYQLPIQKLLRKDNNNFSIIAIWVTNNPKIIKFVKDELLVKWKLEYLTTWHWLKCTNYGEPVFQLDCLHRKPYESVIIACYNPLKLDINNENITKQRLIISVPSKIQHSRKPNLECLFESSISSILNCNKDDIKYMELFARNLKSGWFSWGNEVLLHQELSYFNLS